MSAARPAILVVDDERRSVETIARILDEEFEIHTAESGRQALEILENEWIQVVLSDQRMPEMSGVELLTRVRERWPELVRIIITGYTDVDSIIRSVNEAGIYQFIAKPWHPDQLLLAVRNGAELYRLQREHDRLSLELKLLGPSLQSRLAQQRQKLRDGFGFAGIVRSPDGAMDRLCLLAAKAASFDVPILVTGETGTGKELVARAVHYSSLRADKPFIAVNCGAIPDELLESELFGHKKGAFTGAHANRLGLLEDAHEGTVFLDEIGEISPAFQVKLLRFLQEGEVRPVGANETRRVDVRIIAATNRRLEQEVAQRRFREDLFWRLAVFTLHVPPLRERAEDIPTIAEHLLGHAMQLHGKRVKGFTAEAMACLRAHRWPGNIREVQNEVVRMLALATEDRLGAELLSPRILQAACGEAEPDPVAELALRGSGPLKDRVERMEARILKEVLLRHRWNKSRAAEELGLSRVGLRAKLDRYGILPIGEPEEEEEPAAGATDILRPIRAGA